MNKSIISNPLQISHNDFLVCDCGSIEFASPCHIVKRDSSIIGRGPMMGIVQNQTKPLFCLSCKKLVTPKRFKELPTFGKIKKENPNVKLGATEQVNKKIEVIPK